MSDSESSSTRHQADPDPERGPPQGLAPVELPDGTIAFIPLDRARELRASSHTHRDAPSPLDIGIADLERAGRVEEDDDLLNKLVVLRKTKFNASGRAEDREMLIPLLEMQLARGKSANMRETTLRCLCTALRHKFATCRTSRLLGVAIAHFEKALFQKDCNVADLMLSLGISYWQQFQLDGEIDRLAGALVWIRGGLVAVFDDTPRMIPSDARLEACCAVIELFAVASSKMQRLNPRHAIWKQTVDGVESVLKVLPPDVEAVERLRFEHVHLLARRCFEHPVFRDSIIHSVSPEDVASEIEVEQNPAKVGDPGPGSPRATQFVHARLTDGDRNIRLITLLPADREYAIECNLAEHPLSDVPSFEALSYRWGIRSDRGSILLNSSVFQVAENVETMLRHLRSPQKRRVLWLDAICINQKDDDEKSKQVVLMEAIYSRAEQVILWLGEPYRALKVLDFTEHVPRVFSRRDGSDEAEVVRPSHHGKYSPESLDYLEELRWGEMILQDMEWFTPLVRGSKMVANARFSSLDQAQTTNVLHRFDSLGKWEIMMQNIRMKGLTGLRPEVLDWSDLDAVASILSISHGREDWLVTGAFVTLICLARDQHLHELPFFHEGEQYAFHHSTIWRESACALHLILSDGYWQRTWVLQEIVLAEKPVVQCGPHVVPFQIFVDAMENLHRHYSSECCDEVGFGSHQARHTLWARLLEPLENLRRLARYRQYFRRTDVEHNWQHPLSLSSLLINRVGLHRASDPRDLVYGLASLVKDRERIDVDYSFDVGQVYTRVAFDLISERGDLCYIGFNQLRTARRPGAPSWAPDWATLEMGKPATYAIADRGPGNPEQRRACRLHSDRLLEVRSTKIDTVTAVSPVMTPTQSLDRNPDSGHDEDRDLEWRFWRTVVLNRLGYKRDGESDTGQKHAEKVVTSPQTPYSEQLRLWWLWIQSPARERAGSEWPGGGAQATDGERRSQTLAICLRTEDRRLFTTANGSFGSGPSVRPGAKFLADVSVGDEIHVLPGHSLPVVLRSREIMRQRDSILAHEVVGTCFFDPVMDGHIVRAGPRACESILLC